MTARLRHIAAGKVPDDVSQVLQTLPFEHFWSTLTVLILWGLDKSFENGGAECVTDTSALFFSHMLVVNCVIGIVTVAEKNRLENSVISSRIARFEVLHLAILSLYFCVWSNPLRFAAWLFSAARLLVKTYPGYGRKPGESSGSGKSALTTSCASSADDAQCYSTSSKLGPRGDYLLSAWSLGSATSLDDSGLIMSSPTCGGAGGLLSKCGNFSSDRNIEAAPADSESAPSDTRLRRLRSRRRVQFHRGESSAQSPNRLRSNSSRSLRNLQSLRTPSDSVRNSFASQEKKTGGHRAAAATSQRTLVCNDPKAELLKNAIQRVLLPRHNSASHTLFHSRVGRNSSCKNLTDRLEGYTKKLELMCVEDDKVQQAITAKLVNKYGFRVTAFDSGEKVMECLAERYAEDGGHENFPAIILMDIMLPGMSGYQATEAIRCEYPTAPLPVIVVTGCEDQDTLLKSISCGANDMVEKSRLATCLMARISAQLTVLHFWRSKLLAKKSESLLQEILPRSVIDRIGPSDSRRLIYDEHEEVSIVFTDIVGFTDMSASADTRSVIELLDSLFNAFDSLTKKHGVYKVETIGDAYMLVAGHEADSQSDHALRAVRMAADMVEVARGFTMPNGEPLRIRAGIHSGPAFSGVAGHLRPRYCLFGDTVNVASRMESTSFTDCIQLSSSTIDCYHRQRMSLQQSDVLCAAGGTVRRSIAVAQDEFVSLGPREIKGKGDMDTYLMKFGAWEAAWQKYHGLKASNCLPSK